MIESMPKQSEEWSIAQQHFMDGYNTARKELEHLGWHPASELPPLDKDGDSQDLIVICAMDSYFDLPRWSKVVNGIWGDKDVKWWCYPPKED